MSRVATAMGAACLACGAMLTPAIAELRAAPGLRVDEVATGIPRPVQLAFGAAGELVVLGHGWGGAAGELYRIDPAGPLPRDGSRLPRIVLPFAEGPRKTAFGSLAVDPARGDLVLGEENGNRIYRLTGEQRLGLLAVGLHHLVGGGSIAFDSRGRLVILDFASQEGRLRSEAPPPAALEWLSAEAYHGPLVFRLELDPALPTPRRLDLAAPLFPRPAAPTAAGLALPRFVSVAALPGEALVLLSSLGELFRLTANGGLRALARLPAGHYHRTNLAVAPDGSVFVSSGFHIREIYRVSGEGAVTGIAAELGDPAGIVVDGAGALYVAETALHRIIRLRPAP